MSFSSDSTSPPETREHQALFGEIGFLKEAAEGQSSAWKAHERGMRVPQP